MQRKVLVAVDGSPYSTNSLRYLGQLFHHLDEIHIDLLGLTPVGASSTAAREWLTDQELLNVASPTARKAMVAMNKYMDQARETLQRLGIAPEQIHTEVHPTHFGIADDILHTARKGKYDALLIGRRGIGKLEELIMGSVSAAILEKCHDVPLWIIDGQVNSCKFLVPVDGSVNALRAIDHLGFMISDNPCAEVTLFYSQALLASQPQIDPTEFHALWGKEWCDTHLTRADSLFHAPKQLLIESGFPEARIQWLQTFKGIDPSRQILRQALVDDFGTIVLGRRSCHSTEKGLLRGVSDRVLLMAEQVAVWIVG
ncbi:MAG: universal stress protein [Thermodesulfobacteriota bacterium]